MRGSSDIQQANRNKCI
nr:hypothetical protein [Staphylococcus aureus]